MKKIILRLIRLYQSFPFRPVCKFKPTCSQYFYKAIAKYGILRGSFIGLKRIIKCHPWSKGGQDPLS